ncbi:MAG: radical SAM protein [Bacteroidales bacterium]|jgi:uncharacterized protein|nr:radical SAM protein [Bacteroidales bacterium]
MIWSKYNYLFESEKFGFLLYNSLSNSFIELDSDGFLYLKSIKDSGIVDIRGDTEFLNNLINAKVFVQNDKDEFYNMKYTAHYQRFDNKFLELTLNPTLHCNFACRYCFEENKPAKYMSNEVEDHLIDFIKKYYNEKMHITWFGGEPLMAFDRVRSITKRIQELNINFTSSMITNGYLLSDKIIDELLILNINRLQITIDGVEETHDKRRCLISGAGTFRKIVSNIDLLKRKYPQYEVVIRINVDESNHEEFIKVFKYFYDKYKFGIIVDPGFVDDIHDCNASDCLFNRERKARFLIDLYKKYGLNISGLYPNSYRYECAIRNPYHIVIGPEGEIYKCWNDVGNEKKVVSHLFKKKIGDKTLLTRYQTAGDPFDDIECINCFHLPTCGGGCPYSRLAREFDNVRIDTCDIRKGNLKEFLELHYEYKKAQANLNRLNHQK